MKRFIFVLIIVFLLVPGCRTAGDTASLPRGDVSREWIAAAESFRQEALSVEAPDVAIPYSIMVVDHGKVVFEQWYEGTTPESTIEVYSVSKVVMALAAGCAIEDGLFRVDDKVIGFFPDQLPQAVSDTLSAMTVRDLLTMTCGMEETPKLISVFSGNKDFDWIKEFFNSRQTSLPGTSFYYNFFASFIVAAILEKTSGMGVVDYIRPRLLEPLHITDLEWDDSPSGICVGGWGMRLCTEDMAKIGQLLLQRGKWNGRQLVSAQWVDTMTSNLVPSNPLNAFTSRIDPEMLHNPRNDHSQGYGYFVWRGNYDTYRAEGMRGQYIIVKPEKELVFVITSNSNMDQKYIDLIWKHFKHLFI